MKAVVFALLGVASVALAATAAPLSPLIVGWEQYLTVDWHETNKDGRTLVTGTVRNTSGWAAKKIQLLVDGLDPNGQVVDQRVVWLGTDLPSGQRVYFETPGIERAVSHRVRVFAFDSGKRG